MRYLTEAEIETNRLRAMAARGVLEWKMKRLKAKVQKDEELQAKCGVSKLSLDPDFVEPDDATKKRRAFVKSVLLSKGVIS